MKWNQSVIFGTALFILILKSQGSGLACFCQFCYLEHAFNLIEWVVSIGLLLSHFCSFSYNAVYYKPAKLSTSDVIVSLKGSNGE